MNLRDVSYAMRVASDVARAGERLFDSLSESRRLTGWPMVFGVGVGIGIGALIFSDDVRRRVKAWFGVAEAPRIGVSQPAQPQAQAAARPS